jgi:16S rRNA (adenine1518-N6/adenine1519-N6)-dimethyltransferase
MAALDVRGLLRRYNLHPKKRLGQNFLIDEAGLAKVAAAADLGPADTVLEIGAGLGSLTRHLAPLVQRVVAVEVDDALLPVLEVTLQGYDNVELIRADILRLDLARTAGLPDGYKVAANIPYYITSAVIRQLLESPVRPSIIVLTVQREVAERIMAEPGDMNLLAISVQFYSHPHRMARLPAGAFYPAPAVDSDVIRLDVRAEPAEEVADVDHFFRVVKAGFSQKRKQLRNSLSGGLRLEPPEVDALLTAANISPQRRAETLSLAEWGAVARAAPVTALDTQS